MKTNKRIAVIIVTFSFFSFGCLCCGGCPSREETRKKLDGADASWDHGDKAAAVFIYRTVYGDALSSEKEKMLPRIVEFELKAGNRDEAKTWIKRGLDDKLKADYTDPVAKELLAVARKERDDAVADQARKQKEAVAEAARRAEDEFDANGLVLLMKTAKGGYDNFHFEITGTVVNRRAKKLGYAQITFNVYDESGAQVGSALANINGLEPGGRWNFKAVALVPNGRSYKVSELSGF